MPSPIGQTLDPDLIRQIEDSPRDERTLDLAARLGVSEASVIKYRRTEEERLAAEARRAIRKMEPKALILAMVNSADLIPEGIARLKRIIQTGSDRDANVAIKTLFQMVAPAGPSTVVNINTEAGQDALAEIMRKANARIESREQEALGIGLDDSDQNGVRELIDLDNPESNDQ